MIRAEVIDATKAVTVIHQNHDYAHIATSSQDMYKSPEYWHNMELTGGFDHLFSLNYATMLITPNGIHRALNPRYLCFWLAAMLALHPHLRFFSRPFNKFTRLLEIIYAKLNIGR